MGDMTADYEGQTWYKEARGKNSFNRIIYVDETCNLGEIVENSTDEILPFAPADALEIEGIFMGKKTKGDEEGTNIDNGPVWTDFTLLNCYMSGVALGDSKKPVWAAGANPGCNDDGTYGDLSLTYSAGAKILGCIVAYRSANKADVFVNPKVMVEKIKYLETIGGGDGNVPAAGAFFGITSDFETDIIVTGISYIPEILEDVAKGFTVVAVVDGTPLTGDLVVANADTVHERKYVAVTNAAGCYCAAGTELKLEVDALEGAAPDLGQGDFFVHYLEVPKFHSISD